MAQDDVVTTLNAAAKPANAAAPAPAQETLAAYVDGLPQASQIYGDDSVLVVQAGEVRISSVARLLRAVDRKSGLPAGSVVE